MVRGRISPLRQDHSARRFRAPPGAGENLPFVQAQREEKIFIFLSFWKKKEPGSPPGSLLNSAGEAYPVRQDHSARRFRAPPGAGENLPFVQAQREEKNILFFFLFLL